MNIGIIGAGNVGGTLGKRWEKNGHRVLFSSTKSGANAETAKASEVVLVATPWPATEEAVKSAGDLSGKIVIDATNPLQPDLEGLALGCTTSAAEQVAGWAAGARVVKGFNTVGFNIMGDPDFEGKRVAMFYCGDDAAAKQTVAGLINELGFEALDAGPLKQARLLEPFALLWISLALKYGFGREIAFEMLRRAGRDQEQ